MIHSQESSLEALRGRYGLPSELSPMLRVLDLFSGIGGFSLGLESTGKFETVAFCEPEAFASSVLSRHWPQVPVYPDIRELTFSRLKKDGVSSIHVIAGGFPCQDVSRAGDSVGIHGLESGLWFEMFRLIGEIRPQFVIVETLPAVLDADFGQIIGPLASIGYDAEWHCLPAAAFGAAHLRERLWVVAYPHSYRLQGEQAGRINPQTSIFLPSWGKAAGRTGEEDWTQWPTESPFCRTDDAVPNRVDRIKVLGNSIVPDIAQYIGEGIARFATLSH